MGFYDAVLHRRKAEHPLTCTDLTVTVLLCRCRWTTINTVHPTDTYPSTT